MFKLHLATFVSYDSFTFFTRDDVISLTVKSLKNPRSAVCKTAIMTAADLFKSYKDEIIDLLDPMVVFLLELIAAIMTTFYVYVSTIISFLACSTSSQIFTR